MVKYQIKKTTTQISSVKAAALLNPVKSIIRFYIDGFRSMTLGKTLWKLILIKMAILFFILKLVFFPNILKSRFDTDVERGDYVMEQILKQSPPERSQH